MEKEKIITNKGTYEGYVILEEAEGNQDFGSPAWRTERFIILTEEGIVKIEHHQWDEVIYYEEDLPWDRENWLIKTVITKEQIKNIML